jgi:NADH-quinone oxidoreductase chain I
VEGLSITASHLMRRPITVQYPDRTKIPVKDMLPPVYRGFLDVDMNICTGCTLCMQVCPIHCIKVDMIKKEQRLISRFDIDIGLCMFCGLCTEVCPTSAVHFTREFERATQNLSDLVFKFVKGEPVVPYKPSAKKTEAV